MAIDPDVRVLLDGINNRIDSFDGSLPGAVGDGIADDTAAFQSAVDGLSNGDLWRIPKGQYRITASIDFGSRRGLRIKGLGGQSANDGGYAGASIIVEGAGGFSFNDGGPLIHEGPIVEYVNFVDNTLQGAVLVRVENMNYWTFRNCTFRVKDPSSFANGGVGLRLVQTSGNDNAWGMIDQCRFIGMDVGLDSQGSVGFTMVGGNFIAHTGQVGTRLDHRTQNTKFFGVKFDGPGGGINIDGGLFNQVCGCSFEGCSIGVDINDNNDGHFRGNQNAIIGGFFYGCTTGISLGSGIWGTTILAPTFNSTTTAIDNYSEDALFLGTGNEMLGARLGTNWADGTRAAASSMNPGTMIYNTDDNAPNWSDGTNWRDAAGSVT